MWTVHEVSKIAGVSVRTLHHYDAVGLLKPARITEAGYRLYDRASLKRLQSILMFRELQFPLKEIRAILDSPGYDPKEALAQQIHLLELQQKHIGELISFAREIQKGGTEVMGFEPFSNKEMEQYAKEARERWGTSGAYKEYEQRIKGKTDEELSAAGQKLMALFTELGSLRSISPGDGKVQKKIGELQAFITGNYYNCTDEILSGLGEMYVGDERMKDNIDKAGGEGTAEFVKEAISVYCQSRQVYDNP